MISAFRDWCADHFLFSLYDRILVPSPTSISTGQERVRSADRPVFEALIPVVTGICRQLLNTEIHPLADIHLWMVGRINFGHKNNKKAIDVLQALLEQGRNAALSIVGDGPDLDALKQYVSSLGLDDRVRFLGWEPNPWQKIPEKAIIIIPSEWEGICMVAMEAVLRRRRLVLSSISAFLGIYPKECIVPGDSMDDYCSTVLRVCALEDDQIEEIFRENEKIFAPEQFVCTLNAQWH